MEPEKAQKEIQHIIDTFKVLKPEEYADFIEYRNEQAASKTNEFASSMKDGELKDARHLMEVPATLAKAISHYFPDVFIDKEQSNWFMEKFPQFRITKRI